jgi:GSCFA family.
MKFTTKIEIAPLEKRVDYSHKLLFMGSCFAAEIGAKLKSLRFDILVNPFGVLYNPSSIALSFDRLESARPFEAVELIKCGDIYKSFMHGSEFAAMSEEDFLYRNNAILAEASAHFKESGWISVSLGTSWVYRETNSGKIVSNCHKLPASCFRREILSVDEIVATLSSIIERYPEKNWLFTVSPIRHWKDGAHGNQLSKARLLLAVESLSNRFDNVHYFPGYELMMDELRDYRFYADDMLHPSSLAIGYIWERFKEFAIEGGCNSRMQKIAALNLMYNHRPIFSESKEYRQFLEKIGELEKEIEIDARSKL